MAACVKNVADELQECLSGYLRTGIADFNRLLSDNFEISSYKEDKHLIKIKVVTVVAEDSGLLGCDACCLVKVS